MGKPKNSDIDGTGVKMVPFSYTQQKRFFLSFRPSPVINLSFFIYFLRYFFIFSLLSMSSYCFLLLGSFLFLSLTLLLKLALLFGLIKYIHQRKKGVGLTVVSFDRLPFKLLTLRISRKSVQSVLNM